MTLDEYERRRRRLDEQLRVGIEWLQTAHRQQVEALDQVWMNGGEGGENLPAIGLRPAAPAQPQVRARLRRRAWDLYNDVHAALGKVPEVFDRNHICEQLGYEPDRASLFRTFRQLIDEGVLSLESYGAGRTPSRYRKRNAGGGEAET